jgi:acyl-CoA thioester hydrolase
MANGIFQYPHRVTYAECTVGDHIYYSRYLDVLEAARGEFFRHLGASLQQWQQAGVVWPVIEAQLRYKAPARYDDLLAIELWLTQLDRVRLNFAYRILNQNRVLILEAATQHVCASLEGKPRRLPEHLRDNLQAYLHSVPSAADERRLETTSGPG